MTDCDKKNPADSIHSQRSLANRVYSAREAQGKSGGVRPMRRERSAVSDNPATRGGEMSEDKTPKTTLTRRGFLKATAATAGAAAAVVGGGAAGLKAIADDIPSQGNEETYYSGCAWSCYCCAYKTIVREGKVVNIKPFEGDPRHCRPCLKGYGQIMRVYDPQRVKYPMRRVEGTERGAGKWERLSWDEAIDYITGKWRGYIEEFGPSSIMVANVSAVNPILRRLGYTRLNNIMGFSSIDCCNDLATGVALNRLFGGGGYVYPANEAFDLTRAKTIFMWGANPHVAHPQDFKYFMDAVQGGTRYVVIDPCYTVSASKADRWVSLKVGTDGALALALINLIVQNKTYDEEFLLKHTVAPVLIREDTHRYLRMSDLGVAPTEGPADPYTGVPSVVDPFVVWDADADTYAPASAPNMALSGSFEIQGIKVRTAFDFQAEEAAKYDPETAAAICDIPVDLIYELAGWTVDGNVTQAIGLGIDHLDNGANATHAILTLAAFAGQFAKPGTGIEYSWTSGASNFAPSYPTGMNSQSVAYDFFYDIIETGQYMGHPQVIKSLFIAGANPMAGVPDQKRQETELLPNIDFIVCVDPMLTDMAKHSDVVLPPAHIFESTDVASMGYTNTVWIHEKAIEPLHESKTDQEISRLLGCALTKGTELEALFNWDDEEVIVQALDTPALADAGITWEALRQNKVMRIRPEDYVKSMEEIVLTPSGRIEFYVDDPRPRVDNGQEIDKETERMAKFVPPTEAWAESEFAKNYPIILLSERGTTRYHSQGYGNMLLEEIFSEPTVDINPDDAAARGIETDDYVYFWNDRGHAVAKAVVNAAIRPGVARYQKGWQDEQFKSGNWTWLTPSRFNPVTVNNSFFDTAVEYRKWDGEE